MSYTWKCNGCSKKLQDSDRKHLRKDQGYVYRFCNNCAEEYDADIRRGNEKYLKQMLQEWEKYTDKKVNLKVFDSILDCIEAVNA